MTYIPNTPKSWGLDVSRGHVNTGTGTWISVVKFGSNTDIDTGSYEDIWEGGGTWTPPTTARVHNIASSDVNDTSAGTGARTVSITGLNGSYAITTETVTMNGTSNVATANSYIIITLMRTLTAGSGKVNAGTITATAQTDATVTIQMGIGLNQALSAIYQIPDGYNGYITNYHFQFKDTGASTGVDCRLMISNSGGIYRVGHNGAVLSSATSQFDFDFQFPLLVPARSIIKLSSASTANNTSVSGGFSIVMIPT